jgi:hypothetical protein
MEAVRVQTPPVKAAAPPRRLSSPSSLMSWFGLGRTPPARETAQADDPIHEKKDTEEDDDGEENDGEEEQYMDNEEEEEEEEDGDEDLVELEETDKAEQWEAEADQQDGVQATPPQSMVRRHVGRT